MNSLVITFNESKKCLYKVSIQESKACKSQKSARNETELPVRVSIFQRITSAALAIRNIHDATKPAKRPASQKSWVSKYT